MTSALHLTDHAYERAQQRLGWRGSPEALLALIRSYDIVRLAIRIAGTLGEWRANLPRERMTVLGRGHCITTILRKGDPQ